MLVTTAEIIFLDLSVNTKAEVRLDLNAASKAQMGLPSMSREVIRYLASNSPYYVASSHSLLVSSIKTRTQSRNLQDAMEKVQTHLQSLLSQDFQGETSEEQGKKVKSLIRIDKARMRKDKDKRSSVKSSRRVSIDF